MSMNVCSRTSDCEQLTIASRCPPTPKFVGHASTCVVSLQGVPWVTGVGHCGFKGSTRATSLTICRSIGGWTTADGYREGTGTTLLVHSHNAIQHKQKACCRVEKEKEYIGRKSRVCMDS